MNLHISGQSANKESWAVVTALFLFIPFNLLLVSNLRDIQSYELASLSTLLLLVMGLVFVGARNVGLSQPFTVLVISVFIGTSGKLIYMALGYGYNLQVDSFLLMNNEIGILSSGLKIVLVSVMVISIFYLLSGARRIKFPFVIMSGEHSRMYRFAGLVLLSIGLFSVLIYLYKSGSTGQLSAKRFIADGTMPADRFSSYEYYLFKLSFLAKTSFYFFLMDIFQRQWSNKKALVSYLFLAVSLICIFLISFIFSNRSALFVLAIDFVLILSITHRGIPIRLFLSAAPVLVGLMLILSHARSQGNHVEGKGFFDHFFGGRYFFDVVRNTHIREYVDTWGSFLSFPELSNFRGLLTEYLNMGRVAGEVVFREDASGVPLGAPMEAYIIGGWPLLIVVMAIIGVLLRQLPRLFDRPVTNDYMVIIYAMLASRLGIYLFNNGVGVSVYQILIDVTPFVLTVALLKVMFDSSSKTVMVRKVA